MGSKLKEPPPIERKSIKYRPRTVLGRQILEARARLAAGGFKFLSLNELDAQMDAMRERGPKA